MLRNSIFSIVEETSKKTKAMGIKKVGLLGTGFMIKEDSIQGLILGCTDYRCSSTHGNPVDLERMINRINPSSGAIASDVATGGGHTALALAKCVKDVVAIDITLEMLVEAKIAAREENIDNITFQVEDVHHLNFKDNQFDIVASRFAAHHFSDVKKPRLWFQLLEDLPLTVYETDLFQEKYELPQWFDRMGTDKKHREEVFQILNSLTEDCKKNYPFGKDYITTYRFEIIASKN